MAFMTEAIKSMQKVVQRLVETNWITKYQQAGLNNSDDQTRLVNSTAPTIADIKRRRYKLLFLKN
jgi:hypothetical protein